MDQVIYGEKPLKIDRLGGVARAIVLVFFGGIAIALLTVAMLGFRDGSADENLIGQGFIIVASLVMFGLGWFAAMRGATIWPDRVEYTNGFGSTRSLLRSGIKGFRYGPRNLRIILIPRDEFAKPIQVSAALLKDVQTKSWFEGVPDLDAQDLAAAQKEFEKDPRLGATDTDRRAAVARMALAAKIVNGAGFIFGLWALLTPLPYYVPVYGAIAAMTGALALKLIYGSLLSFGGERSDPRPSVTLVVFCGMAVGLRGMTDNHVLDWVAALEYAGGVALAVWLFLVAQDERMRLDFSQIPFVVLALVGFFYGTIVMANRMLDYAQPAIFRTWVDEKHVNHGKSTSYTITLDKWGDHVAGMQVNVSSGFFDSVQLGEVVCVSQSKGALGLRYFTVDHCAS